MQPRAEPTSCSRCKKNTRLKEAEYCRHCLAEVIENRVSRKLSNIGSSKGSREEAGKILIACDDKNSLSCKTAAYIAKKLCRDASILVIAAAKLFKNPEQILGIKGGKAIIMPKCADDIATGFMERITANDRLSKSRNTANSQLPPEHESGAINIFESITEKELELYAAIKRIKYLKGKNRDLKRMIQKLQARYPGTIEALAQSSRQADEI